MVGRGSEARGIRVGACSAVLVVLFAAPVHSMSGQSDLPGAEAAAKADAESAEGKRFTEAVGQAFGREHAGTIQQCAKETKRPDLSDFDLFLRVDGAGVVDQALVKPGTPLATCVAGTMRGWKTSVPPRAGFWLKVGVNLRSR